MGKETARKSSETNATKAGRERQDKTATANQSSDKSPQIGLRPRVAYSWRSTTEQQIFVILPGNVPPKALLRNESKSRVSVIWSPKNQRSDVQQLLISTDSQRVPFFIAVVSEKLLLSSSYSDNYLFIIYLV